MKNDRTFPLILHFNYNKVLRPRCELLKEKVKYFDFEKVLPHSDESFCKFWNVDPNDLKEAKRTRFRKNDNEKDYLWGYVDSY